MSGKKIGLLVARSVVVPFVSRYIKEGMELGFKEEGADFELVVEDIGNGAPSKVKDALEKVLLVDHVDLVVATITPSCAMGFRNLFEELDRVLILVNMGERRPFKENWPTNFLINSMMSWQTSAALGFWLVENKGKKIARLASLYDAGNDQQVAFTYGVNEAGGELAVSYITHIMQDTDFNDFIPLLNRTELDILSLCYTGKRAKEAVRTFSSETELPVAVSPIADGLDEQEIILGSTWDAFSRNPNNQKFIKLCNSYNIMEISFFHVLAYEVAHWISFAESKGTLQNSDSFKEFVFHGPRGEVSWNEETLNLDAQIQILKRRNNTTTSKHNFDMEKLLGIARKLNQKNKSGFITPYIFCT